MVILIKNLKIEKPTQPWQVKVECSTPLGNPYKVTKESDRDRVCNLYQIMFERNISSTLKAFIPFQEEVRKLETILRTYGKLELFCWCHPLRCHASTIKTYLEKRVYSNG